MSHVDIQSRTHDSRPHSRSLRQGRVSVSGQIYHVTSRTVANSRPFENFDIACVACRSFRDTAARTGIRLLACVLMPDHAHWLVQLSVQTDLSKSVAAFKRRSASAVNAIAGARGVSVWQDGFHDRALRHEEDLLAAARYIVANPLRAGLVSRLGDYPFWDSIWLLG